jgi:hypothetical protein
MVYWPRPSWLSCGGGGEHDNPKIHGIDPGRAGMDPLAASRPVVRGLAVGPKFAGKEREGGDEGAKGVRSACKVEQE